MWGGRDSVRFCGLIGYDTTTCNFINGLYGGFVGSVLIFFFSLLFGREWIA